mgnify:CR=1 FL=1
MAEKKTTKKEEKKAPKKTVAKKPVAKKPELRQAQGNNRFAVIATGGKQYVVHEGDILDIEKINAEEGKEVDFSEVLLVDDGKTTKVGAPTVSGSKVTAELIEQGRGKKISVIRFRSKSRYFKNKGHRQPYSKVKVTKIS